MVQQSIIIKNHAGLHMRPAGVLAKAAGQCSSNVTLIHEDKRINAKSVLNIMSAAIKANSEIIVECEGENEAQDLATIIEAIESGLGE